MSVNSGFATTITLVFVVGILTATSDRAQNASASSLADQLKAQYKVAKIVPESNGYKVAEPGTMLVIQKDGIFGVPLGNNSVDPVIYAIQKDSDLHHSTAGANTWKFELGHKVYLSKLDVDAKHDKVFLTIVECDSSNPVKPSYYKSVVDFEFPNGYLTDAEVGQIENVIKQVLTIDNGTNDVQPQVQSGQNSSTCLTNDEIIKLVQAKLLDSIVLAKIKSASCEFDTSADALIKLKKAGVSDLILQAILDAQVRESPPDPDPINKSDSMPACTNYDACIKMAQTLFSSSQWARSLTRFQEASQLDESKGDAWAGIGYTYFQMGQYDDSVSAFDKALQLGATLSAPVCHATGICGDTGFFLLSTKEVAFVNKRGEKELLAAPSAVTSEGPVLFHGQSFTRHFEAYYLQIRFGKNWRFYYLPPSLQCSPRFACPEPGLTQQSKFAEYVHAALARMAAGDFGSQPNKP